MTREEFLRSLRQSLYDVPIEELENIIRYYEEYFDEAGLENEQSVIEELGTPQELAATIRRDIRSGAYTDRSGVRGQNSYTSYQNPYQSTYQNGYAGQTAPQKGKGGKIVLIVLAIIGSPLWISLLVAAVSLVIGLFAGLVGLLVGFAGLGLGMLAAGAAGFVGFFATVWIDAPTAVATLGGGLCSIGVGLFICLFFVGLVRLCIRLLRNFVRRIQNRKRGKVSYEESI